MQCSEKRANNGKSFLIRGSKYHLSTDFFGATELGIHKTKPVRPAARQNGKARKRPEVSRAFDSGKDE